MGGHHALVFGASGIQGWAITNQILKEYPSSRSFSRVTALTNSVIPLDQTLWPQTGKLHVVSGIDLLIEKGEKALERRMKEIYDIDTVSHVYFCAYVADIDPERECEINTNLLVRAVTIISRLSSTLKFVVLPTGTKAYGVHLKDKFPFHDQLPLRETHPRISGANGAANYFYRQADALKKLSEGQSWTWCELRPDVIVGFVPNHQVYSLAQQYAVYLSIFREVHGKDAECPWPGTPETYKALSNDASQDTIAQFAIFASLHPEACGEGQIFNVADRAQPVTWAERWPAICEYFEVNGVPPSRDVRGQGWAEYMEEHKPVWQKMAKKHGLKDTGVLAGPSAAVVEDTMKLMDFHRNVDVTKMLATGFRPADRPDVETAWWTAFDRFREANIIP